MQMDHIQALSVEELVRGMEGMRVSVERTLASKPQKLKKIQELN